jgi:indole-3-glycerol phosphate synthase
VTGERTMYLPEILAHTRAVIAERRKTADIAALEHAAAEHTPRGFALALRAKALREPAIIAELKKASPSKGLIRPDFDPSALATEMQNAGAAVLSVLTDENLLKASAATTIPCLRKDFMVDPFQVIEARANGADAILLIVAALTDAELRTLRDEARRWDLDVLCEVHDAAELQRALPLECECVGVNSRDLRTFEVSLDRACELAAQLPDSAVRVAESGIHTREDIQRLRDAGFDAFLIGESLMKRPSPGEALKQLLRGQA